MFTDCEFQLLTGVVSAQFAIRKNYIDLYGADNTLSFLFDWLWK